MSNESDSITKKIKELHELKMAGALSENEFQTLKKNAINEDGASRNKEIQPMPLHSSKINNIDGDQNPTNTSKNSKSKETKLSKNNLDIFNSITKLIGTAIGLLIGKMLGLLVFFFGFVFFISLLLFKNLDKKNLYSSSFRIGVSTLITHTSWMLLGAVLSDGGFEKIGLDLLAMFFSIFALIIWPQSILVLLLTLIYQVVSIVVNYNLLQESSEINSRYLIVHIVLRLIFIILLTISFFERREKNI